MKKALIFDRVYPEFKSNKHILMTEIIGKPVFDYITSCLIECGFDSILLVSDEIKSNMAISYKDLNNHVDDNEDIFVMPSNMLYIEKDIILKLRQLHIDNSNYISCFIDSEMYYIKGNRLKKYAAKPDTVRQINESTYKSQISYKYETVDLVNNKSDLVDVINMYRNSINKKHMLNGVTIVNNDTTYIGNDVVIGVDTVIEGNTKITGKTSIGSNCKIISSTINNTTILDNTIIVNSYIDNSSLGKNNKIGPFANIKKDSKFYDNVIIGTSVEVKNSIIESNSKIKHQSYIGDAHIHSNTNIGAGVVFANYNGVQKNKTVVGSNSFIGSNTNLIAPLSIGDHTYVAAGSTVNNDLPNGKFYKQVKEVVVKDNKLN